MKKQHNMKLLFLFISLNLHLCLIAQSFIWANSTVNENTSFTTTDIAIDSEGNSLVLASCIGIVQLDTIILNPIGGEGDIFLAEISDSGAFHFANLFGSKSYDRCGDIAIDKSDNIFLTANISGDSTYFADTVYANATNFQVIKLAADGSFISTLFIKDEAPIAVLNKNIYIAYDSVIAKYDNNYLLQWQVSASSGAVTFSNFTQEYSGIAINKAGHLVVTGYEYTVYDKDTIVLGSINFSFDTTFYANEICVVKLDTSGNVLWVKTAGSNLSPEATSAFTTEIDSIGNVYAGLKLRSDYYFASSNLHNSVSTIDESYCAVVKYDKNGNEMWAEVFSTFSPVTTEIYDMHLNPENELVLCGAFSGYGNFGSLSVDANGKNYYISKISPSGVVRFFKTSNKVENNSAAHAFAIDSAGSYIISGIQNKNPGFDCFHSNDSNGVYLAKLTEFPFAYATFEYTYIDSNYYFEYTGGEAAISWQWDFGNGETSTEENPETLYETGENYTVTLIVSNGICNDTSVVFIENAGVGIADAELQNNFILYPNPVNNSLHVIFNDKLLQTSDFCILNIFGQSLASGNLSSTEINVIQLPAGIYKIVIYTENEAYSASFIKQ